MIYRKDTYVVLGAQRAVQIHGGVQDSQNLWLIVETLRPGPAVQAGWQRGPSELALLPLQEVHPREPMRLVREGANSIWLLR